MSAMNPLSAEQRDQVERFQAAFHAVEQQLRALLDRPPATPMSDLIHQYAAQYRSWPHLQTLRTASELRNLLAHRRTTPYGYPAIPAPALVAAVETIRDQMLNPRRVVPTFQCAVTKVQEETPLSAVLQLIHQADFSQFPVYRGDSFQGLLTENGIARWLAYYAVHADTLIELADESVAKVLQSEEQRTNFGFIGREATVEEAASCFAENSFLEALLITQHGRADQSLLGIITRWDMLQHAR